VEVIVGYGEAGEMSFRLVQKTQEEAEMVVCQGSVCVYLCVCVCVCVCACVWEAMGDLTHFACVT